MRTLLPLVLVALCLAAATPAMSQYRGGRQDAPARRGGDRGDELPREFAARLWYGAGGTLGFQSFNESSFAAVGLSPQVGYKFTPWLSAGPRVSVTWNTIKGFTVLGDRQRSNTWDFGAGGFARAKVMQFYGQTEVTYLSNEFTLRELGTGRISTGLDGQPETIRDNDLQWLVGVGYSPSGPPGSLGTDIGIFYNLFDDVTSNTPPISFRLMLTFNY